MDQIISVSKQNVQRRRRRRCRYAWIQSTTHKRQKNKKNNKKKVQVQAAKHGYTDSLPLTHSLPHTDRQTDSEPQCHDVRNCKSRWWRSRQCKWCTLRYPTPYPPTHYPMAPRPMTLWHLLVRVRVSLCVCVAELAFQLDWRLSNCKRNCNCKYHTEIWD